MLRAAGDLTQNRPLLRNFLPLPGHGVVVRLIPSRFDVHLFRNVFHGCLFDRFESCRLGSVVVPTTEFNPRRQLVGLPRQH